MINGKFYITLLLVLLCNNNNLHTVINLHTVNTDDIFHCQGKIKHLKTKKNNSIAYTI